MFGIRFFKGQPTDYIIRFVSGKITREGQGLAFYYLPHNTQIVAVPTGSADANFIFNESTNNYQAVTIQGQFTYRIRDPKHAAALLNFSIDPVKRTYSSDDPEKLAQRITNVIQTQARSRVQARTLEDTLRDMQSIAADVQKSVQEEGLLEALAVELLSVYFISIKPTPEVAKALEAEYRESLLRRADEAIYARRASAVEEERKIKEKELNTEITLEQQKLTLINQQGQNSVRDAELKADVQKKQWGAWAWQKELESVTNAKMKDTESEALARSIAREAEARAKGLEQEMSAYSHSDPRLVAALAMRELGQNAARVGNLTITSEMFAALLNNLPSKSD